MSDRLSFVVMGPPQPKERARRGAHGRWYTPRRTRAYEQAVRKMAALSTCARAWDRERVYRASVAIYFGDARKRDADNVAKAVLDACNKVLWMDDSQVMELTTRKFVDRTNPRTEVTVEVIEMAGAA